MLEQGGDYFCEGQPAWGEGGQAALGREPGLSGGPSRRPVGGDTALNDYLNWPGLGQVCCVERIRKKGRETVELAIACRRNGRMRPGCWRYGGDTLKTAALAGHGQ